MSTDQARPDTETTPGGRRHDVAARALGAAVLLVPAAAVVSHLLGAPRAVAGLLVLLGLGLAVDAWARRRGRGWVDRALVDLGGVVVAVVLTGMVLGSVGPGLRTGPWVLALALVAAVGSLAGVVAGPVDGGGGGAGDTGDRRAAGRRAAALAPWLLAAAAVTAFAVARSATSLDVADRPGLEMSLAVVDRTTVEVLLSTGEEVGPVEVRVRTGGDELSYPLVDLGAGDREQVRVVVPPTGRAVVGLYRPDQTQPLRTLLLNR